MRILLVALLLLGGCTHKTITYIECRRTMIDPVTGETTVDTLDHITWDDRDCIDAYLEQHKEQTNG